MSSNDKPRRAHARFFVRPRQNKSKSIAESRPIFDDIEMVEFTIPGDKLFKPVFPAHERPAGREDSPTYAEAYPDEYAAFKRGELRAQTGTPLEKWPHAMLTAGRVAELKAINIFSVEDLAAVADGNLNSLGMGGREFRGEARAYLENAKSGAGMSQLAAKNDELERRLAAMQDQIAALVAGAPQSPPQQDKALEDCSDDELKAFIKRETGEGVKGNPKRETLLAKAAEIAARAPAEAA